ncbi:MAG: cation:proton antiporter, partial [Clostridiales bacterium]
MENNLSFNSLFIISILAFVIPIFVNKLKSLRVPVVVAEIFAGILVGKTGFNLIHDDLWLEFLSLFGFAYLMFLSGVEIDFSYFKKVKGRVKNKANPLVLGIVIFISTLLLAYLASTLLVFAGIAKDALFFTLIFSTTSLGIVVPVLKEKGIINESIGQISLLSALMADFLTMLLIPIVIFLVAKEDSMKLLTSLFIFVIFGIVYFVVKRFFKFEFNNSTYETSQLKIRAAFVLVLIFVKVAEIAEVEIILGAFLAGVLFSVFFDKFRTEIAPKLDAIGYGFLIPIFFIMVGARIDLRTVLNKESLVIVPLFILIAYAVKIIPVLIIKKYFTWKETIGTGFLISSRLSLIIAISIIALDLNVIDESMYSTFVIIAVITCICSPLVFQKL